MIRRLLLCLACSVQLSLADSERVAQVEVEAAFKPVSAIGLLISKSGTLQKPVIKWEKSPLGGSMLVSFGYKESEVQPDTMAGAMLVSETGGIILAHLRPLFKEESKNSFLDISVCPPEKTSSLVRGDSYGMLQSLIDVRTTRRDLSRQEMQSLLSGPFLDDLNQYEVALGLSRPNALSASLHPVELIDRLQRLSVALRKFMEKRKSQESDDDEPPPPAEK